LVLPKPPNDEHIFVAFYKKSHRKTFDLAILNAAFVASIENHKIRSIKIVFGGSDQAIMNSNDVQSPQIARKTIEKLTGMEFALHQIDRDVVREAVFNDVSVTKGGPGNYGILRKTSALTFLEDFLQNIC
jgi:hypothetical protein